MKNPMANKVKPDMIPCISATFFFFKKESIVEKMHLLVLFSECYVYF